MIDSSDANLIDYFHNEELGNASRNHKTIKPSNN